MRFSCRYLLAILLILPNTNFAQRKLLDRTATNITVLMFKNPLSIIAIPALSFLAAGIPGLAVSGSLMVASAYRYIYIAQNILIGVYDTMLSWVTGFYILDAIKKELIGNNCPDEVIKKITNVRHELTYGYNIEYKFLSLVKLLERYSNLIPLEGKLLQMHTELQHRLISMYSTTNVDRMALLGFVFDNPQLLHMVTEFYNTKDYKLAEQISDFYVAQKKEWIKKLQTVFKELR